MTGNIVIGGLLGQGLVLGGFLQPGTTAAQIYIIPQLASITSPNTPLQIDPTAAAVILAPTQLEIDPTQATVILP